MFDELKKYKQNGHFFFKPKDTLSVVCNAPANCSGIYLIYALQRGTVNLIYIGISGRMVQGKITHRKDGLRGRFITGEQFGALRKKTWPLKMLSENIEALDIYWYVTHGSLNNDSPREVEIMLLTKYLDIYGALPKWNNKI